MGLVLTKAEQLTAIEARIRADLDAGATLEDVLKKYSRLTETPPGSRIFRHQYLRCRIHCGSDATHVPQLHRAHADLLERLEIGRAHV